MKIEDQQSECKTKLILRDHARRCKAEIIDHQKIKRERGDTARIKGRVLLETNSNFAR